MSFSTWFHNSLCSCSLPPPNPFPPPLNSNFLSPFLKPHFPSEILSFLLLSCLIPTYLFLPCGSLSFPSCLLSSTHLLLRLPLQTFTQHKFSSVGVIFSPHFSLLPKKKFQFPQQILPLGERLSNASRSVFSFRFSQERLCQHPYQEGRVSNNGDHTTLVLGHHRPPPRRLLLLLPQLPRKKHYEETSRGSQFPIPGKEESGRGRNRRLRRRKVLQWANG